MAGESGGLCRKLLKNARSLRNMVGFKRTNE
jgi:hypothetical protein